MIHHMLGNASISLLPEKNKKTLAHVGSCVFYSMDISFLDAKIF